MTIRHTFAAVALCALGASQLTAQAPTGGASSVTFTKDVAPIFYKNCTNCHRPGEIAPMSLLTYKDARPWARSIGDARRRRQHAAVARGPGLRALRERPPPERRRQGHDRQVGERRCARRAIRPICPRSRSTPRAGQIGQPDAVFALQEDYPIPASGTIEYQYFEVPTNFTEDKWVQAFEVKPGDPPVVHHVIVYARPPAAAAARPRSAGARRPPAPRPAPLFEFAPNMEIPAGQTGGRAVAARTAQATRPERSPAGRRLAPSVGGFAPGQIRPRLPGRHRDEAARRLDARLPDALHDERQGRRTDRTRIGVMFAKDAAEDRSCAGAALINGALHIPAGDAESRVDAEMTIDQDITLWSMLPHTHVRGKRWIYDATYPDGRNETILSVPNYDFNWQTDYVFKQPLKLPKGTKLHATAWYDNSTANKSNPDPTKDVGGAIRRGKR